MTPKLAAIVVAALVCPAGIAGAQTRGPVPLPPPTIYAACAARRGERLGPA